MPADSEPSLSQQHSLQQKAADDKSWETKFAELEEYHKKHGARVCAMSRCRLSA